MARHPKQAQYERTSRHRQLLSMQAISSGWTKLDTLDAYLTGDGELIVIDKALNRYATTAEAEKIISPETPIGGNGEPPVAPAEVSTGNGLPNGVDLSVVPQSIAARRALELAGSEHSGTTESEVRTRLAKGASQFLAALKLLDTVHGPEWREKLTQMTT